MNLSFFYTKGGSGAIRGRQVADYLKAKHNPKKGYEKDVCIFVKIHKYPHYPKKSYLDVCDAPRAIELLEDHPELGVIAFGETQKREIERILKRKDIVLIPHHHCNFKRELRLDRPVRTVGIIGSKNSFQYPIKPIREKLEKLGLKLKYEEDYWNFYGEDRQKVVDFYKDIDIQIVWRPKAWSPRFAPLRIPLKLSNAGSFGIPTIGYPEPDYMEEWEDSWMYTKDIDELLFMVGGLKRYPDLYGIVAKKALEKAENYHIEHIAKLYKEL